MLPAPTTAAHTATISQLPDEPNERKPARDPHKRQHRQTQICLDVHLRLALKNVAEDDEHDGCYDAGNCDAKGRGERENGYGEEAEEEAGAAVIVARFGGGRPWCHEDAEKEEAGADNIESEHPVRGNAYDFEGGSDVGGESN